MKVTLLVACHYCKKQVQIEVPERSMDGSGNNPSIREFLLGINGMGFKAVNDMQTCPECYSRYEKMVNDHYLAQKNFK